MGFHWYVTEQLSWFGVHLTHDLPHNLLNVDPQYFYNQLVTNFIAYQVLVSPRVICRSNLSFRFFAAEQMVKPVTAEKK